MPEPGGRTAFGSAFAYVVQTLSISRQPGVKSVECAWLGIGRDVMTRFNAIHAVLGAEIAPPCAGQAKDK